MLPPRIQRIVRFVLVLEFLLIVCTGKTLERSFSKEGFVPGCEFAGVVQEIGGNVKKVKKGDRVRLPLDSSGQY
jgi:D-arabinose 1-dehydrogenase-like Zn-dependent alcohol dehydrogenase